MFWLCPFLEFRVRRRVIPFPELCRTPEPPADGDGMTAVPAGVEDAESSITMSAWRRLVPPANSVMGVCASVCGEYVASDGVAGNECTFKGAFARSLDGRRAA